MTTRNVGLLLSNASAPAAGISKTNIVQWYGGPLRISASGVFDGVTVDIMVCARFPHSGDPIEYTDNTKFTDADFTSIHSMNAPAVHDLGNVNPCALAIRVSNPGSNTRVKVVAS